jgi:hypothetical protein
MPRLFTYRLVKLRLLGIQNYNSRLYFYSGFALTDKPRAIDD